MITLTTAMLCLVMACPTPTVAPQGSRPRELPEVAIQPLGEVDASLVRSVARHLESVFAVEVVTLPRRSLPASAYYPPRDRYRGERVIADLEARTSPSFSKVLGLMSRDLSIRKGQVYDWGVLGVAGLSGRAAVVSVHRLGGGRAMPRLRVSRLNTVATHELGHAFGLPHCPRPGCIMNDARGTIRTVDRTRGDFCPACRARLRRWLRSRDDHVQQAGDGARSGDEQDQMASYRSSRPSGRRAHDGRPRRPRGETVIARSVKG